MPFILHKAGSASRLLWKSFAAVATLLVRTDQVMMVESRLANHARANHV